MDSVKRFHLIIVDELGYVPIKPEARSLLFELFAKLYEQTSIIITTHLKFEEWGEIFGNAKATKAIIGGLSVNLRFFRKSLNKLGNIVLFRDFCTEVFMG
jgi:DNA replication protein DnaC